MTQRRSSRWANARRAAVRAGRAAGPRRIMTGLRRNRPGTIATEYLLLLATIILPLALLTPLWFGMIRYYAARLINGILLPFP